MATKDGNSGGLYSVLGLNKECTASELKVAYKKLALRWHPDRCYASGNSVHTDEAKRRFQAIQQAYSVLSDANKRFLYDIGAYENDDDENDMSEFLNEMAVMINQTKSNENGEESFEELQKLFNELFRSDIDDAFPSFSQTASVTTSFMSPFVPYNEMNSSKSKVGEPSSFELDFAGFCVGTGGTSGQFQKERSKGKTSRK